MHSRPATLFFPIFFPPSHHLRVAFWPRKSDKQNIALHPRGEPLSTTPGSGVIMEDSEERRGQSHEEDSLPAGSGDSGSGGEGGGSGGEKEVCSQKIIEYNRMLQHVCFFRCRGALSAADAFTAFFAALT